MVPEHLAIIMDGNRRWAKKNKKMFPWLGHKAGLAVLEKIISETFDCGVKYLTVWALSEDNFQKRDKREVKFLMRLVDGAAKKFARSAYFKNKKIKINFFGRFRELFPKKQRESIEKIISATKTNKGPVLNILLAYGGKSEMLSAVSEIVKKRPPKTTEETLLNNLWTGALPPIDLIIRTGGEPHFSSGFMMWHASDSQLYFTETLWPDFNKKELTLVLEDFSKRRRRFGG